MGNTDSTKKLGERVLVAKRKLKQNQEIQSERYEYLKTNCPAMLSIAMESMKASFKSYSPFLEPTLLLSWIYDEDKCKNIVLDSCRKVLSAPIDKKQYLWFKEYVFESSLWFFKTKDNKYMYEELLNIATNMSKDIVGSMDSIYKHLETHSKWNEVMDIKDVSIVSRQDQPKVGLFQNAGFKDLFESKIDDEKSSDMQNFVDSNIAINILTSTATSINQEFQNHVKAVMSHYGDFQSGPVKKVERCLSKLENDYQDAAYPKASKLLDLVRCSVTFNTVDQLITGYKNLVKHISNHENVIELARIKNGFLDPNRSGYRDIKLNVIYKSEIDIGTNIICEIQLLLINYLQEKKRIHKLYSIVREALYFQMVTKEQVQTEKKTKDVKDLRFVPCLNIQEQVKGNLEFSEILCKCSMDSELGLLALEGYKSFKCVDIKKREVIFEQPTNTGSSLYSHNWFSKNNQKYLSLQTERNTIKIFEVNEGCKFKEDAALRITLQDSDSINYCEFDRNFDSIFIVKNKSVLQKRSMKNVNDVLLNIKLQETIGDKNVKQMSLSDDGNICVIADGKKSFYLIDIPNNEQHKMKTKLVGTTFAPCFINGQADSVAICSNGELEIWDVTKQVCTKTVSIDTGGKGIYCSASIHNILAIGSGDKMLRLLDVRTWESFYSQQFKLNPFSLHLTENLKYVTIGGFGGEQCVIVQIE